MAHTTDNHYGDDFCKDIGRSAVERLYGIDLSTDPDITDPQDDLELFRQMIRSRMADKKYLRICSYGMIIIADAHCNQCSEQVQAVCALLMDRLTEMARMDNDPLIGLLLIRLRSAYKNIM